MISLCGGIGSFSKNREKNHGEFKTTLFSKRDLDSPQPRLGFRNYTSCASNPDDRLVTFSGFLEDYSGFRPASEESKAWTHRKANLTLAPYTKIMIDPLVFWADPEPDNDGVNAVDQWQLKLIFQEKMEQAFQDRYAIVHEAGPEVLRLRSALTKVMETRPHSHLATPGPILPTSWGRSCTGDGNSCQHSISRWPCHFRSRIS